jgi:glyoxylase-like metal-dependent hydrolase (beta-lactamase superfamily II)
MRPMREVIDGVFEIEFSFVHAYLVVTDDGVVFVDTGLPGRAAKIEEALTGAKKVVGDVKTILLTHWHTDHTGGVAGLQERSGARVVAHQLDAPVIDGSQAPKRTFMMRLTKPITGSAKPVPVDEVIEADGPISVPGFRAIHTPGHTAGHVSYLFDREGGLLFVGDAAGNSKSGLRHLPGPVTTDPAAARESVGRLAGLDFDVAVFGHGPAVTGRAVEAFKALTAPK